MSKLSNVGHKLYTGEISYDFVGRRRRWYLVSAILIVVALASLGLRGLSWGIEFKGGADFQAPVSVTHSTVDDVRHAVEASGVTDLGEASVTTIGTNTVRVQTRTLDVDEVAKVRGAIAKEVGIKSEEVAYSLIGASWGKQITDKALIALVVFLVLVTLVIWAYFRNGKMSIAALVALLHDLVLTVGIYALVGFTVSPATLIGVLTILGYSLYDTVVVFDKVRENVRDIRSSTTRTYSEGANLAVNQVLVRSINTTVIGVLPVAALLFAGAAILGTGPLKDLALALFVGMVSGAYSSIFIATPLLAQMKEREPEMVKLRKRVENRRAKETARTGASTDAAERAGASRTAAASRRSASSASGAQGYRERLAAKQAEEAGEGSVEQSTTPEQPAEGGSKIPITVTRTGSTPAVGTRPLDDAAAKRPQPQHRPRSQRKK
ncbi:protein translocase subunit SecF [Microlunatus panaciterrae]|uniref:Protein-export membrane protein SecF n=1 Tax=Microlunatus panaciterrae TaxID=400768 RepID=A0ABS2RE52_9ACTN|nr:preprotein translocase subunit SecF [Microlunatus panaciterrae]